MYTAKIFDFSSGFSEKTFNDSHKGKAVFYST